MGSHRPRSVSASDATPSASNVGAPDSRVNVDVPQGEGVTEADRSVDGAPTHLYPTFCADNPAAECVLCGGTKGQHAAGTMICPTEWEEASRWVR